MPDQTSLKCTDCGSETFVLPNNPPHDDDDVTCAGCGKKLGTYAVLATNAKAGGIISNVLRKTSDLN